MTEAADDPAVLTDRTAALLRAIEAHLQELLRLSTTYVNKEARARLRAADPRGVRAPASLNPRFALASPRTPANLLANVGV